MHTKGTRNIKPLLTNGPTTINHYHTLNGEPLVPTHDEEEQQKTENVKQTLHDKTHGKIQKPTHSIKPKAELLNMSEKDLKQYVSDNHPDQSEDTATKFGLGKKDKKTKSMIAKVKNPNELNSAFQIEEDEEEFKDAVSDFQVPVSEPTSLPTIDFIEPVAAATEEPDFDHDTKEEVIVKDTVSSTVDSHGINHVKKASELKAEKKIKKSEAIKNAEEHKILKQATEEEKQKAIKNAEDLVVVKNKVGRPNKAEAAAKALEDEERQRLARLKTLEIVKVNKKAAGVISTYKLRGSKKKDK
jgi:hypothetical protein